MDQMIDILKNELRRSKQTLGENDWETIASYLVGQTPISEITGLIQPQNTRYVYYDSYQMIAEIADACKKQPALFARLGRYLVLLKFYSGEYCHAFAAKLCEKGLSLKEIFLDSEFGASALLHYLFDEKKTLLPETATLLELVFKNHREELEGYILQNPAPYRTVPLAYYCTKVKLQPKQSALKSAIGKITGKGEGSWHEMLEADMLLSLASLYHTYDNTAIFTKKYKELDEAVKQAFPAAYNSLKASHSKLGDAFSSIAFSSLCVTDLALDRCVQMAKLFLDTDYTFFLNSLSYSLAELSGKKVVLPTTYFNLYGTTQEAFDELVTSQLAKLEEWIAKIGGNPAVVCAWSAEYLAHLPAKWSSAFQIMYGESQKSLEAAIPPASPLGKAMLHRMLHDRFGVEMPASLPALCANNLLNCTEIAEPHVLEQVISYILSDKKADLSEVPDIKDIYNINGSQYNPDMMKVLTVEYSLWTMAGIHPAPLRYLNYLLYHLLSKNLSWFITFQVMHYEKSPEWIADYLDQSPYKDQIICCLAAQWTNLCAPVLKILLKRHPESAVWAMAQKSLPADIRLSLLEELYTQVPDYDEDYLLSCLGDKSKKVREYAVSFLLPKKHLLEKVRTLTASKKKEVRETAERLIIAYEGEDTGTAGADDIVGFCMRNLPKNAMSSIKWAFDSEIPPVRWKESNESADSSAVLFYLHSILTAKNMQYPAGTQKIRELLNEEDMHSIAQSVFAHWLSENAPAKTKGALLLMGIHADNDDVPMIQKQIDFWAQNSRSAIAADAVWALALGGSDLALMAVDSMGQKYKNKQVRRAGQEAFAAAAQILGTTPEVLGDRIVPALGFDERGEKTIDYGTRQFTAILSPALTIQLQDSTGKAIKSLPKPGAKDDTETAEKAKAAFTALKKSLKTVVTLQSARLEQALSTGRHWNKDAWEKLFVKNPIMHNFAISLIWGTYKNDTLMTSFRYMEDGSFTDQNEDDFDWEELGELEIGLVHPLELGAETVKLWQEQLSDYDIVQPISQLSRAVYLWDGTDDALTIDLFGGKKLLGITLMGKLQKLGWYKGSVQDAGCFYTFYKETGNVGMQLIFSGMYVSPDLDEVITVGQAAFYKAGSIQRGSYVYDDLDLNRIIKLVDVAPRLYSELVYDLTIATGTSTETDNGWASDSALKIITKR